MITRLEKLFRRAGDGPGKRPVVAVVTDAIYPYHMGGKEVRYHHLVAGLAARDIEVHVFTMNWWHGPKHKVEDGVHYHALCRHYPLYTEKKRSFLEAVMFTLACCKLIAYRFDLIEADEMPHLQLFPIRLIATLRRVPLMVTWHEFWGRDYWREYLGAMGSVAAVIEQYSMRCAEHLVTHSPETAARLVEQGIPEARISVVPVGLDLAAIEAAPPATSSYDVLYVGRLLHHKNVDALVEAIALRKAADDTRRTAIVGEGPERERLEALVDKLELRDEVEFLGNLPEASGIFGLMKRSGVFVLPSTREGFGIVVAEAMACGTPVITTNHPDNQARALVNDGVNGWLCEASAESIAAALVTASTTELPRPLLSPDELDDLGWDSRVAAIYDLVAARLEPRALHRG